MRRSCFFFCALLLASAQLPLAARASDPQIASLVVNPGPVAAGGRDYDAMGSDNHTGDAATRSTST